MADALDKFIRELKKAELHVHLEGSVEPETVVEIDSTLTVEEVKSRYQHNDFAGFLQSYIWVNRKLQTPAHYGLVARRLIERLAAENIRYAEVIVSAGVILWKEQNFTAIFDELENAVSSQQQVELRWVLDAVRQFGAADAQRVAELAVERRDRGVVGFGIGGDEPGGPAGWFRDVFAFARQHGLAILPHAGETVGAESVAAALDCGAHRIGHGIRAIEDGGVVRELRDRGVALEVCITSNVCTGAVPSLEAHPVRRLFDAGVKITLNTDDPALFRTDLGREYRLAADSFGFSEQELQTIAETAWNSRCECLELTPV